MLTLNRRYNYEMSSDEQVPLQRNEENVAEAGHQKPDRERSERLNVRELKYNSEPGPHGHDRPDLTDGPNPGLPDYSTKYHEEPSAHHNKKYFVAKQGPEYLWNDSNSNNEVSADR